MDINTLKSHLSQLFIVSFILLLASCTSHEEIMKQYKEQALSTAWQQEQELVSLGHSGTYEWTEAEKQQLLKTGTVIGYEGRYFNQDVESHPKLATNGNNIYFAKIGEKMTSLETSLAPLRSYLVRYEKNKYGFWGALIAVITVLIIAFQRKRGIVIYPAIVGAILMAIRMGVVSGGSYIAIFGGLASGLIAGTIAGIFIFLVVLSAGVG
jgi:hypothetical protein